MKNGLSSLACSWKYLTALADWSSSKVARHRACDGGEDSRQRGDIKHDAEDVVAGDAGDGCDPGCGERQPKLDAPQPRRRGPIGAGVLFVIVDLPVDPALDILRQREHGPRNRPSRGIGYERRGQVVSVRLDLLALNVEQVLRIRPIVRRGAGREFVGLAFERLRNRARPHPGCNVFLAEQTLGEKGRCGEAERARDREPSARIRGDAASPAGRRAELARQRGQKGAQHTKSPASSLINVFKPDTYGRSRFAAIGAE